MYMFSYQNRHGILGSYLTEIFKTFTLDISLGKGGFFLFDEKKQ